MTFDHDKFGPLVDATPARENLTPLAAMGVSSSFIQQLTGISPPTIEGILAGRETARQHHVETLAGLSMQTVIDADPLVDTTNLPERVNNASKAGWPHAHIAEQAGVPRSWVSNLAVGTIHRSRLSRVEPLREVLDKLEATGPKVDETLRAGGFVDATPAMGHVKKLMGYGLCVADIANTAGIAYSTVRDLSIGRFPVIKQVNAEAILGTSAPAIARRNPMVSLGNIRDQIRELNLQGWSQEWLAEQMGLHQTTLSSWQTGRSRMARLHTVRKFQALYAQLNGSTGPHSMSAHVVEAKRPAMLRKRRSRAAVRRIRKAKDAA